MVSDILPLFELLHVSSDDFTEKVSLGRGFGSQTSPCPSPSKSFWSALATLGQLSLAFTTPSPSMSLSQTSPSPSPSVSFWSALAPELLKLKVLVMDHLLFQG